MLTSFCFHFTNTAGNTDRVVGLHASGILPRRFLGSKGSLIGTIPFANLHFIIASSAGCSHPPASLICGLKSNMYKSTGCSMHTIRLNGYQLVSNCLWLLSIKNLEDKTAMQLGDMDPWEFKVALLHLFSYMKLSL